MIGLGFSGCEALGDRYVVPWIRERVFGTRREDASGVWSAVSGGIVGGIAGRILGLDGWGWRRAVWVGVVVGGLSGAVHEFHRWRRG